MRLTKILAAARRIPDTYHNMPKRFVDRHQSFLVKKYPNLPQYRQKIFRYKVNAYHDEWRPWETQFQELNSRFSSVPDIIVEPIADWHFYRGDRVEVIRGKDVGKQGIIQYIVKERNWVFVEGLNLSRTVHYIGNNVGKIISEEQPYLINTEVKLVDPSDLKPTDIEWRYDDDGNKVRVSVRTDRLVPIPALAYSTIDYTEPSKYKDAPKDTDAKEASKVTFKAVSKTFEMDICDEMCIEDDRVPYPMYWY